MCLAAIEALPPSDAVDVGCGSGLLTQGWAACGRGRVLAIDVDPAAIAQTATSAALGGVSDSVATRRTPITALAPVDIAGRTVLANIPLEAHVSLLERLDHPPPGVVVSGFRLSQAPELLSCYRALGLRTLRISRSGGFVCAALVAV